MRGATQKWVVTGEANLFQPTRPLRGATRELLIAYLNTGISTHAPLAGRDDGSSRCRRSQTYFINPRAPCGARQRALAPLLRPDGFQPTRPLRGATSVRAHAIDSRKFQPTRPLRGATADGQPLVLHREHFNPRAPCGARLPVWSVLTFVLDFNPRAPCGARRLLFMYGSIAA